MKYLIKIKDDDEWRKMTQILFRMISNYYNDVAW